MLLLAALLAAQAPFSPPPVTLSFRTVVDVLAFSDDGQQALLQETSIAGPTIKVTLLLAGTGGVSERLPISDRTKGIRQDRVDVDVCHASADRISGIARDFRGISVIIGLCSAVDRKVITTMQKPRARVLSKEIGAIHTKVGFAGQVFTADRDGIVVVIGENVDGSPRIAVTTPPER